MYILMKYQVEELLLSHRCAKSQNLAENLDEVKDIDSNEGDY